MNEPQHRVAEPRRVFPVIESPCHFVAVGWKCFAIKARSPARVRGFLETLGAGNAGTLAKQF